MAIFVRFSDLKKRFKEKMNNQRAKCEKRQKLEASFFFFNFANFSNKRIPDKTI